MSNTVYQFLLCFVFLFFILFSSSFTFQRQFRVRSFSVIEYFCGECFFFLCSSPFFRLKRQCLRIGCRVLVGGFYFSFFFLFFFFICSWWLQCTSSRKCERAGRCMIYFNVYYGLAAHECFVVCDALMARCNLWITRFIEKACADMIPSGSYMGDTDDTYFMISFLAK